MTNVYLVISQPGTSVGTIPLPLLLFSGRFPFLLQFTAFLTLLTPLSLFPHSSNTIEALCPLLKHSNCCHWPCMLIYFPLAFHEIQKVRLDQMGAYGPLFRSSPIGAVLVTGPLVTIHLQN